MKNYNELKEFLDGATSQEKYDFLKECKEPLLPFLVLSIENGQSKHFHEAGLDNLDEYLPFLQKFFHDEIKDIILIPHVKVLKNLISLNADIQLITLLKDYINLSNQQLLSLIESLTGSSQISAVYNCKNNQLVLESSVLKFNYLIPHIHIHQDDDFDLMKSIFDEIKMDIIVKDDTFMAIVHNESRNQVEENKSSILNKISMIASRVISSPVTKYAGVALALGLVMTGNAEASSKDAVDYLEAVNTSLSSMGNDLPSGCEFGVKILSKNGLGINFEVNLGDYMVNTKMLKTGNIYESVDQTVYKLKEAKGCGLSKADAVEMANKMTTMVKKLWIK